MEHNHPDPNDYDSQWSPIPGEQRQAPPEVDAGLDQATWERGPEAARMAALLFDVEQRLNDAGWDRSARLLALDHVPPDGISVQTLAGEAAATRPLAILAAMKRLLSLPEHADGMSMLFGSPVYCGLVLAWEGQGRSAEAAAASADPTRPPVDQPGSVETRVLMLHTASGHELVIQRIRGQQPALLSAGNYGGDVVDDFRALTETIDEIVRRGAP